MTRICLPALQFTLSYDANDDRRRRQFSRFYAGGKPRCIERLHCRLCSPPLHSGENLLLSDVSFSLLSSGVSSTQYSESQGPGSSSGQVMLLCFLARHFIYALSLSTLQCKWELVSRVGLSINFFPSSLYSPFPLSSPLTQEGRGIQKLASNLLFYSKNVLDLGWTTTDVFRFSSVRPLKVSRISTVLKQIFRFLINSLVFT